jgi:ABC-type branched-subunit amino acid transport system substrate-binding protein
VGPFRRRVAVLVPLSGESAALGGSMLRAARLALQSGSGAPFDQKDTKDTPDGAMEAARAAIAAGAGIVVGPLTAAQTEAVAALTGPRGIPVLAFTSDSSKGRPGVWPMGITPASQVRTLVRAVQADGKSRIGALLPENPFGDALADGLLDAAREAGLPPPHIVRYSAGPAGLDGAITQLAGDPAAPPSIDALLLGTTADATLAALPSLSKAGLGPDRVRLLGTAIWGQSAPRLGPLAGAWFAAPDPARLRVFEQNYMSRYGVPPLGLASVAYDAAAAAKAVTGPQGVNMGLLLNPRGFSGANGVFVLLPDGHVRRDLALFEIGPNGVRARQTGAPLM